MHLIFFDIQARSLPGEIAQNAEFHPLQFNYSVGGRIELLLDDNKGRKKTQDNSCKWCKTTITKILTLQEYTGILINFKT